MAWDAEARATAYRRAKELERRDPDAAAELLAILEMQAGPSRPLLPDAPQPGHDQPPRPFPTYEEVQAEGPEESAWDPMAAYAACARAYHFGHREMEGMHYPTFFGYLREAVVQNEREEAAINAQMGANGGYGAGMGAGAQQEVLDPENDPAIEARLAQYAAAPRRWEHARDS